MSDSTCQPAARIPLSLVTGFLGSGKTTFLRQLSRRLRERRIVYLVNEFSALDVDSQILQEIGPDTVSIPGGSIFCKCLVVNFLYHLQEIPRRFGTPDPQKGASGVSGIDGVVVEASGIANPKVVADMLRETKLDGVYDLASIVTIVDPGSLRKLLVTLPSIRAQIEAADIVLLNKIDRFAEGDIAAAEAAVRDLNATARLIRTTRCAADVELFGAGPARDDLHGEYAECADPHYSRFGVPLEHAIDLLRLQGALAELADDLYRVKGFVPTPEGTVYLDGSTAGLSLERVGRPAAQPGLAMIARADRVERVEAFIADIQAGRFRAAAVDEGVATRTAPPAATMIFVGGFLGAGKTTLLARAARLLASRNRRVGLITNDQAPDLVDTARLAAEGFAVGEVAGSCFCCDFAGLVRACDRIRETVHPDVILAEPVGSCTDISATVLRPFRNLLPDRYRVAPFSVLADPGRLRDALEATSPVRLPSSVHYIFQTQLAEADLVVLNKTDTISPAELRDLEQRFAERFADKPLLRMSARSGEGVEAWLDEVLPGPAGGRTVTPVDYDLYAEGEAALGWLNAVADLETAEAIDWRRFCGECVTRIGDDLQARGAEVAHLKVRLETRDGPIQCHLTRTAEEPWLDDSRAAPAERTGAPVVDERQQQGFATPSRLQRAVLLVNARVHAEPDGLREIVLRAIHGAADRWVEVHVRRVQSFRPRRPDPTHREPHTLP